MEDTREDSPGIFLQEVDEVSDLFQPRIGGTRTYNSMGDTAAGIEQSCCGDRLVHPPRQGVLAVEQSETLVGSKNDNKRIRWNMKQHTEGPGSGIG